ncbi:hypothetical protein CANCADRAFT_1470 [Tortispora caseinolytica NRRL Y-17796]|uniref:Exonuclease V, mitochondrial n=1 Tax=Tortispora caseinolytica NRRL Y-17796 TaxID=767744 RepID=A0A1E4TM93_9ASCO|nr:hypothetical protein CANCADRAFT_1470 [Tortispora caseinolytica NRRL Y-17796]
MIRQQLGRNVRTLATETSKIIKKTSVTSLLTPWCELQQDYYDSGILTRRTTLAMKQGTKTHAKIEKIYELPFESVIIEVPVLTFQDRRSTELLVTYGKLCAITQPSIAKSPTGLNTVCEVKLFGHLSGCDVTGIIDAVGFGQKSPQDPPKIYLRELKTMHGKLEVSQSQKAAARLQAMVYYKLFNGLADGSFSLPDFLTRQGLQLNKPLNPALLEAALESNVISSPSQIKNFGELAKLVQTAFSQFEGMVSEELCTEYINDAKTGVTYDKYIFDEEIISSFLSDRVQLFLKNREPRGVPASEAFKCRICPFSPRCPVTTSIAAGLPLPQLSEPPKLLFTQID